MSIVRNTVSLTNIIERDIIGRKKLMETVSFNKIPLATACFGTAIGLAYGANEYHTGTRLQIEPTLLFGAMGTVAGGITPRVVVYYPYVLSLVGSLTGLFYGTIGIINITNTIR
jgi:hypothetical protein